ncbi:hypothetical protein BDW02DRAFT_602436 [Decorospora gaudefroyi]|uniref:Uncharacterized protein n=1 Tax=Decorospora gaudefroyi TaxID=184978 RepID=A0A6A5K096_9PLEO|nr:hypothetical protein BDW02DRAFT_602436 [Decorospora gaudefroyi]
MLQSRKFYISLVGVVAWSSTAADAILCILEAASFSTTHSSLVNMAAVAGAFDVVSLCCIGFYAVQNAGQIRDLLERSGQARAVFIAVSILVSLAALVLSLVLIIMIKLRWEEVTTAPTAVPVSDWNSHVSGQIAAWVISCVSQIVLYSSPFWNRKAPKVQTITTSGPRDSVMSELRPSRPNNLYLEPAQPSSPLAAHQQPMKLGALPSPTFSARSSQSLKSFRDSLRHVVRPVTSRTTLISQKSFNRDAPSLYSDRQSIDTVSHSDGFDSWDTSSVSLPARDTVLQTAPSRGTTLEPIPGSRPNSPARALDGPFLSELPEEEDDDEDLHPPPKMMPDVSRPASPAVSEAHIHPLFRSESPSGLPPPTATPGTSILASPLASQAIACPPRPFSRMRSNSQLSQTITSPSGLHQARSFSRNRSTSLQSTSRSPSPPSRAMTPPIPDFVLNSSPRSSMSGSRRVQLQYSPDR